METYAEQILAGFEEELMSCPQGCHVSRQVLPGSEEARRMTVGSGRQCSMLLNQSSPLGRFSKILLESSHWGNSMEYSYVWGRLDTKFALSAFQLTALGQNTLDIEYSLWRTPDAHGDRTGQNGEARLANGHALTLNDQTKTPKLWPTPSAGNFNDGESLETWEARREANKAKGINGNGQGTPLAIAAKLWPTPTVPNGGRRNPEGTSITGKKPDGGKAQIDIREFAVRMLPTPQAHDAAKGDPARVNRFGTEHGGRNLNDEMGGSLNPEFVEVLMGYPIGWTALED